MENQYAQFKKGHSNRKRLLASLIALGMASQPLSLLASDYTGRVIAVETVSTAPVEIVRNNRPAPARAGQRLNQGNEITTAANAYTSLLLDDVSVVNMAAASRVLVDSTGSELVLALQYGQKLVNAGPQATGETLGVRVGNRGLTVRGTLFTVAATQTGVTEVVMLSGLADFDGVLIEGGQTLFYDPELLDEPILAPIVLEELDIFTLQAIIDHAEYLYYTTDLFELLALDLSDMDDPLAINLIKEAVQEIIDGHPDAVIEEEASAPSVLAPVVPDAPAEDSNPSAPGGTAPEPDEPYYPDYGGDDEYGDNGYSDDDDEPLPPYVPGSEPVFDDYLGAWVLLGDSHIQWLRENPTVNAALGANITVTAPIPNFNGTLSGRGHVITLDIASDTANANIGLFGVLGADSQVSDLRLTGSVQAGSGSHVGGLAGRNYGTIAEISVSGLVVGSTNGAMVGGLVGTNDNGTISNSVVTNTTISAPGGNAGGIVGSNSGSVTRNIVSDIDQTGGFVGDIAGENGAGLIQNNASSGNPVGVTSVPTSVNNNHNLDAMTPDEILELVTGDSQDSNWELGTGNLPVLAAPPARTELDEELPMSLNAELELGDADYIVTSDDTYYVVDLPEYEPEADYPTEDGESDYPAEDVDTDSEVSDEDAKLDDEAEEAYGEYETYPEADKSDEEEADDTEDEVYLADDEYQKSEEAVEDEAPEDEAELDELD